MNGYFILEKFRSVQFTVTMAEVAHLGPPTMSATPQKRGPTPAPLLSPTVITDSNAQAASFRSGHLNFDTFSPVNQNGSFEFDRVLKSGKVHRRVKKKGAWKPSWKEAYLVLRPNLLSVYQDSDESGLRAQITLSEVTAVTHVKKTHTQNVFGIFSPAKNYHFQGATAKDSADWIDRIKFEARIESRDEQILASSVPARPRMGSKGEDSSDQSIIDDEEPGSPDVATHPQQGVSRSRASTTQKRPSQFHEYSGNEMMTSMSDFSDTPIGSLPKTAPISAPKQPQILSPITSEPSLRPTANRNVSQNSGPDTAPDADRVIRQGWLQILKSTGGVKQWKTIWVVLRPRSLAFYKNEQEYATIKLISISTIINAADIDPISKSKKYCFQVILEDKTYRFSASDEETLAKWLGAIKSVLAKRQDKENMRIMTDATALMQVRN